MPEFTTPFNGDNNDRILTKDELVRAIRFGIAAEYESIQLYEQLSQSIDNKDAQKLLEEIADDEKVHVGNFLHLLKILAPEEEDSYKEGWDEAEEVIYGKKEDKKES